MKKTKQSKGMKYLLSVQLKLKMKFKKESYLMLYTKNKFHFEA